jgi:hypothetical protein
MRNFCIVTLLCFLFLAPVFGQHYDASDEIRAIRQKIEAQGLNWIAGHNSVMELPPEERRHLLGLEIPDEARTRFEALDQLPVPALVTTQDYFNWQEFNCISPVDDQRDCGSCWDFAATHAFEAAYIIVAGEVADMSEQQGLVCNWGGSSCNGGWMEDAYEVYMDYGAVEEECMPYWADDDYPCTQDQCVPVAVLDAYENIPNNVNAIKNAVLYGPLSTTFTVYNDFYAYRGGCYEHADTHPLNHAVVIVGWDDNMCDGEGAWIVKNSWGTDFGMDGFFYMKYGSAGFGQFTQRPIYGVVELPAASIAPDSIGVELYDGGQATVNLELDNTAAGALRYKLSLKQPEGQDEFGYYWRDSNEPDGPEYNWLDISTIGDEIYFPYDLNDGNSGWLNLGFDFTFYGNDYHRLKVCTNGWVSFMDGWFVNADNLALPDVMLPNDLLAVFWDDLAMGLSGNAYFYTNNSDTAIITWDDVTDSRLEGRYTFQVILVAPSTIIYQYNQMAPARLDESSIGIENRTASIGLEVARNEAYVQDELAIEFYLGDSNSLEWLAYGSESGLVDPYSSLDIPITFDAQGLQDGIYNAVLQVLTNDINMLVNEIPVTLAVGLLGAEENEENLPSGLRLEPLYPNPFNAQTLISYSLSEDSQIKLEAYNLMGQKVATLFNGFRSAGEYSVSWKADELASGMYFIKISNGQTDRIERAVLLK